MDATEQLQDALLGTGDVDAALAAIAAGADLRRIETSSGGIYTALTWAVGSGLGAEGSLRLVRALIAAGMTVAEEHPSDGLTSLHRAAEEGFVQVIEALLGAGGKSALGSFDYINRTPLICAVQKGHLEAARVLIDAGSDVNAHDEARAGDPALRRAIDEQNVEMVELLLRSGADPTVPGWMQVNCRARRIEVARLAQASLAPDRRVHRRGNEEPASPHVPRTLKPANRRT